MMSQPTVGLTAGKEQRRSYGKVQAGTQAPVLGAGLLFGDTAENMPTYQQVPEKQKLAGWSLVLLSGAPQSGMEGAHAPIAGILGVFPGAP